MGKIKQFIKVLCWIIMASLVTYTMFSLNPIFGIIADIALVYLLLDDIKDYKL